MASSRWSSGAPRSAAAAADAVLDARMTLTTAGPGGQDDFVELDEAGNPLRREAGAERGADGEDRRGRKRVVPAAPRRKPAPARRAGGEGDAAAPSEE